LDQTGQATGEFADTAGLVAATRLAEQQPTWVVTGTDAGGVRSAARAFSSDSLANHFAVVVGLDVRRPVPVEGRAE
jgi:hypothetical protein